MAMPFVVRLAEWRATGRGVPAVWFLTGLRELVNAFALRTAVAAHSAACGQIQVVDGSWSSVATA